MHEDANLLATFMTTVVRDVAELSYLVARAHGKDHEQAVNYAIIKVSSYKFLAADFYDLEKVESDVRQALETLQNMV